MPKFKPGDEVMILKGALAGRNGFIVGKPRVPTAGPIWYKVSLSPHDVSNWYSYVEDWLQKCETDGYVDSEKGDVTGWQNMRLIKETK